MADYFSNFSPGLESPANNAFAITPSDTVDLPVVTRAIYVGGGGSIAVILAGDASSVTLVAVPVGSFLAIRAKRVLASTTATNLVGFY